MLRHGPISEGNRRGHCHVFSASRNTLPAIVAKLFQVLFGRNITREGTNCPKVPAVAG
jgi:hypothetical protein